MSIRMAERAGSERSGSRASTSMAAGDTRSSMPRMESRGSAGAPRGRRLSQRSLKLAVIGTAAGFFSGLFGVGGGTVMVPLLVLWLAYEERPATGTSLAAIIAIASFAAGVQALYRNVKVVDGLLVGIPGWPACWPAPGCSSACPSGPSPCCSQRCSSPPPCNWCCSDPRRAADRSARGRDRGAARVGGGVVFVPGMVLFLGLDQHHAVATSLLAIIPVAILGTIRQDRYGNVNRHDAVRLGALSIGGAAAGVALANALPGQVLRDLFAAFMVFVAVRLVRQSRHG